MNPASETVRRTLDAGLALDVDAFTRHFAPDAVLEWPYHPSGAPLRLEGRDAVRAHMTRLDKAPIRFHEYRDMTLHETTDPEVVIVEYQAVGSLTTTGAPYVQRVIAVIRVHEGLITSYRDYIDPLLLTKAFATS